MMNVIFKKSKCNENKEEAMLYVVSFLSLLPNHLLLPNPFLEKERNSE